MISKKFQKILYIHDYVHQWSDSHDDYTLDCGVWVKGLHVDKNCTECDTNLIVVKILISIKK